MSTRPLVPPPFVQDPPGGLGSNSNYIIAAAAGQCSPITDLIVTIDITQDLVLKSSTSLFVDGYGFQLNAYSPPNFLNAWQQFIFLVYGIDLRPVELEVAENDYTVKEDELINNRDVILILPDTTIPAGYQLQIQLKTDINNNVVGALYVVNDIGFLPTCTTALTGYWFKDTSAVTTNNNSGTTTTNNNTDKNPTEQHINYIGIEGHVRERFRRA